MLAADIFDSKEHRQAGKKSIPGGRSAKAEFIHTLMFNSFANRIRRIFGAVPVSYEVSGERIMVRSGDALTELVRVADIQSWRTVQNGGGAVSIRLRDSKTSIVVGDRRGLLRELLARVADDRRVLSSESDC